MNSTKWFQKDRNIGKHFMVINEETLPKLERQMSPELKRSRSVTCLEIEIECRPSAT